MSREEKEKKCNCDETCDCGCNDGEKCTCNDEHCHGEDGCDCGCNEPKVNEINLDYLDIAQRLKAEFDNYKKRNLELSKTSYDEGAKDTISSLLPVIDGFDQALKSIDDANILEGVTMLKNQFVNILENMGVKKIECIGKMFDPNIHNAVLAEDSNEPKDTIIEELQAGYYYKNKVLRHSVVKISK